MEAAIGSRQWAKAVQILEMQDSDMASRYYKRIGDHYASIGEYEVRSLSVRCHAGSVDNDTDSIGEYEVHNLSVGSCDWSMDNDFSWHAMAIVLK